MTSAQNVALAGSAFMQGTSATSPTWAVYGQCQDQTGVQPPTSGCHGAEFDTGVPGTTNGGEDPNKQRIGVLIAGSGAAGTHIGAGILMGVGAGAFLDRGVSFGNLGSIGIGIDFGAATVTGAALLMAEGQKIAFDGNGGGGFNRSIDYQSGSLIYNTEYGQVVLIGDHGAITLNYAGLTAENLIATAAAPTVASGQIGFGGTTAAASFSGSLPSAAGSIVVNVAGTTRYIPYF